MLGTRARISKKVEGGICLGNGYFFNAHLVLRGDNTSKAVIVPGTMIDSGGGNTPPSPPPVIRWVTIMRIQVLICM